MRRLLVAIAITAILGAVVSGTASADSPWSGVNKNFFGFPTGPSFHYCSVNGGVCFEVEDDEVTTEAVIANPKPVDTPSGFHAIPFTDIFGKHTATTNRH